MIRLYSVILFIGLYTVSNGQDWENRLAKINSVPDASVFIENNPQFDGKLFTIESGSDTSELFLHLYEKKNGFTFQIGEILYKILQIDSFLSYRVNYIYLDGTQFSKFEIDSLRRKIITAYQGGTNFIDLAMQYNMDGNITGDTRWFAEGMMAREFETAIKHHKKGEIFNVDTPDRNWYHVVLKSFDDAYMKTVTILKLRIQPDQ